MSTLKEILDARDYNAASMTKQPKMIGRIEEFSIPSIFTSGVVEESGFIFGKSVWGIDSFDEEKAGDAELYGL